MKQILTDKFLLPLREREEILRWILAFLGTYGLLYTVGLVKESVAAFSVFGLFLLPAVYGMLSRTRDRLAQISDRRQRRRRIRYAAVVGFFFAVSLILGYQLQMNGMTDAGFRGKGLILFRGACLNICFFPFFQLLFGALERIGAPADPAKASGFWRSGRVFGVCALVIFLCLIPVWLAYYPIVMSYDFHRQVNEAAKGFIWFYPYQPLAHTWVIWVFLQLGRRLGNLEAGFGAMALFQMLLYSLVTAYCCVFLYRVTRRRWTVIAATLFFALLPLNTVLVVCTTKDVLFTILFLLFHLLLAERFFYSSGRKKLLMDALLVLVGVVMVQFRNNALYAVAIYAVIWLILAARKEKLRVLLVCVLLLAGGRGAAMGIKEALGTEIVAPKVEMYSVPVQQLARVGYAHNQELSPEMWRMIDSYVSSVDGGWDYYMPGLSDPAKAQAGGNFQELDFAQFLQDWFYVGIHYPNEFIDAFLELTRGYWFLDDRSYAECLGWGVEGRMGVLYTYNSALLEEGTDIVHVSQFPWLEEQLEKIVSGNAFYRWPVVSTLFKSSFYVWGMILVFVAYFYRGQKRQALYAASPLIYMCTVALGPIVQIRYAFPAMVMLPLLLGLLCCRGTEEKDGAEGISG